MLGGNARNFFIELLGNLDEPAAVNLTEPLDIAQERTEFEESAHDLLDLVLVEGGDDVRDATVPVLEETDAAASFGIFLVVKGVDVFEITIKGEEKLCRKRIALGHAGGWRIPPPFVEQGHIRGIKDEAAHLQDPPRFHSLPFQKQL